MASPFSLGAAVDYNDRKERAIQELCEKAEYLKGLTIHGSNDIGLNLSALGSVGRPSGLGSSHAYKDIQLQITNPVVLLLPKP